MLGESIYFKLFIFNEVFEAKFYLNDFIFIFYVKHYVLVEACFAPTLRYVLWPRLHPNYHDHKKN